MQHDLVDGILSRPVFSQAYRLQVKTLTEFHRLAREVAGASVALGPVPEAALRFERNFFSTFFLAVTDRMLGGSPLLPLYAMVNQAMRAWVTACDNILDEEYKEIFPFSITKGDRMRSVLTLLIADRALTEYVSGLHDGRDLLVRVGRISLSALITSALQECEEEVRPVPILPPQEILDDIHVRKTGELFLAPLTLPLALESVPTQSAVQGRAAAKQFGLACQALDDIKDMPDDVRTGRHNLLVSLLCEGGNGAYDRIARLREERETPWASWERFPKSCAAAWNIAADRFRHSFDAWESLGIPLSPDERTAVMGLTCGLLRVPVPAEMAVLGGG